MAYDFTTRITKLPPETGDRPVPIVPLKALTVKKRTRSDRKSASS
jgi:hypothetical protein